MIRRFLLVLAALLPIGVASAARAAQEADFKALFPSIVRVVGMSDDSISLGSGVVVAASETGSYVITNYHVLANADPSRIRIVSSKPAGSGGDGTIVSPARYVSGDSSSDVAVLYVSNFFAPPVELAVSRAPENLSIRAIGYPATDIDQWRTMKATPTMTDGIVSTTETAPWRPGAPAVGQVQHTADLNVGMSGGPLMDLCGRILAINTAFNSTANGVNLALSAADITPYLERQNIAYKSSKAACDPAAAEMAKQQEAAAALAATTEKARRDAEDKAQTQTRYLLFGGVAALVVVLVLAGLILSRNRKSGSRSVAASPVSPAVPTGPGHGLLFKGLAEAAGQSLIVRAEELADPIGAEIGRGPGFGSSATGRSHARVIWISGAGFILRDLGSLNGTRVNGREIKGGPDQSLNLGDVVEFGAPDARYSVEKL
jgi:hypothetical protein